MVRPLLLGLAMLRTHVWLSSWLGLAVLAAPAHAAPPLTWQAIGPVRATPMLSCLLYTSPSPRDS